MRKHSWILIFVLSVLFMLVLPNSANAATITVDETVDDDPAVDNGSCSLREAISAANTDSAVDSCIAGSGEDIIVFDSSIEGETIVLDRVGAEEDGNATGDLDVDSSDALTIGSDIAVIGGSDPPDPITIDGNGTDRILHAHSDVTLLGRSNPLILQNGGNVITGGGIRAESGATLNLESVEIRDNSLQAPFPGAFISGGGINAAGPLNMIFTRITNNTASGDAVVASGGGIRYSGSGTLMTISLSRIEDNTVSSSSGGAVSGGGIDVISSADVEISGSRIIDNIAEIDPADLNPDVFGGAINFQSTGTLTISESVVRDNIARIQGDATVDAFGSVGAVLGGGISFMVGDIIASEISNNTASSGNSPISGAGIHNAGNLDITNSTLSGNTATSDSGETGGGGLFVNAASVTTVNNSTIAENSLVSDSSTAIGGGIENDGGSVTVSNTIVALNIAGTGTDCAGNITSDNFNLVGDDSGCVFAPMPDDLVNVDPMLGPLADNGGDALTGETQTHALLGASPAVDAGSDTGTCETEDQRGEMRPADGDGDGTAVCDIGAFERQENAMPTVDSPITDQTLEAGGADFTIDLTTVFSDPDGDPLTFFATSGDPSVADTSVSGDMLTVMPLTEGTVDVTVTAEDTAANTVDDVFQVIVTASPSVTSSDGGCGSLTGTVNTQNTGANIIIMLLPLFALAIRTARRKK